MNPERFARLRELVLMLAPLPEGERAAWLDRECSDDDELRREALSLLDEEAPDIVATGGVARLLDLPVPDEIVRATQALPDRIGAYRVLGVLGVGGMGIVYRAEQSRPLRREVAIKVVRPGLSHRSVVHRFDSERQALALMEHPSIARVLDAGEDDQGRPYFVMELVRGVSIREYCRDAAIATRQRVELFTRVCRGVQHAHQKGVIHRDLKPSNVLITEHEGEVIPKIIDFGIAKALEESVPFGTVTAEGQPIGTVEYMSPEQASGRIHEIDTRSDVYSLGVILYELVCDRLPLETRGRPLLEAARMVAQDAPRPPELSWSGHRIDDDLTTILGKALEKEPENRYASAAAMADDIDRYLQGRPILARPHSTTYQLKKLVARNRIPVALGTALVVLLMGFAVTMAVMFGVQRQERARAETEAEKAREVSAFLSEMLSQVENRGQSVTVADFLRSASTEVDRFDDPVIRGQLHLTIGSAYVPLREYELARRHLDEALQTFQDLYGPDHPRVADVLSALAAFHKSRFTGRADLVRADSLARAACDIRRRSYDELHPDVVSSLAQRAGIQIDLENYVAAESLYTEAISRCERQRHPDPLVLADLEFNRGRAVFSLGRREEAKEAMRSALARRRKAVPSDNARTSQYMQDLAWYVIDGPESAEAESLLVHAYAMDKRLWGEGHVNLRQSMDRLGTLYLYQWRFEEGEPLLREALALVEKNFGERHEEVAEQCNDLAALLDRKGSYAEAERYYRRALDIWSDMLPPDHGSVMISRSNLARVLGRQHRPEEALKLLDEGLQLAKSKGAGWRALYLNRRAIVFCEAGRFVEAERDAREALEISAEQNVQSGGNLVKSNELLGWALLGQGKPAEAQPFLDRAYQLRLTNDGTLSPAGVTNLVRRATCRRLLGHLDEAEAMLEQAQAIYDDAVGRDHPAYPDLLLAQAALRSDRGDDAEALAQLQDCRERLLAIDASDPRIPGVDQRLTEARLQYAHSDPH